MRQPQSVMHRSFRRPGTLPQDRAVPARFIRSGVRFAALPWRRSARGWPSPVATGISVKAVWPGFAVNRVNDGKEEQAGACSLAQRVTESRSDPASRGRRNFASLLPRGSPFRVRRARRSSVGRQVVSGAREAVEAGRALSA